MTKLFKLTLALFIVVISVNIFIESYMQATAEEFKVAGEKICTDFDNHAKVQTYAILELNKQFSAKSVFWELTTNQSETEAATTELRKAEIALSMKDQHAAVSHIKLFIYLIDNITKKSKFW